MSADQGLYVAGTAIALSTVLWLGGYIDDTVCMALFAAALAVQIFGWKGSQ